MNKCVICSKDFIPKKNTTGKYCSRHCAWIARGGVEFNSRIAKQTAVKRGNKMRGSGEGKSYRKLNGVHEHRKVAELTLGRKLKRGEIVHHIDGNHLNNSPENLMVMSQSDHMKEHGLGKKGMSLTWKPWEARWNKNKSK